MFPGLMLSNVVEIIYVLTIYVLNQSLEIRRISSEIQWKIWWRIREISTFVEKFQYDNPKRNKAQDDNWALN